MIIELRKKAQIIFPKEIVKNLNLQEGDKFEYNTFNNVDDLLKSIKDDTKE